jgi:hypothetical protein
LSGLVADRVAVEEQRLHFALPYITGRFPKRTNSPTSHPCSEFVEPSPIVASS